MSNIDVKAYIGQLREALPYVPSIPVKKIKALHKNGGLGSVVKLIRKTMNVDVGLTIHWTSGPPPIPGATAWISLPEKMPRYGTAAFKELKLDIFILKSFAETKPYDQFAIVVAHELSHVVLKSIEHPLRKDEKAIDLTAMILGFSYLYRNAAHRVQRVGYNQFEHQHLGYLSDYEVDAAAKILVPPALRVKRGLIHYAGAHIGLAVLLSLGLLIWAGTLVSSVWKTNETHHPADSVKATESRDSVRAGESSCIERLRSNRRGITSKQAETFCNCYLEEIGSPPTQLQEKIDLVTSRCDHEAFGE
jgi:hypothetical protein